MYHLFRVFLRFGGSFSNLSRLSKYFALTLSLTFGLANSISKLFYLKAWKTSWYRLISILLKVLEISLVGIWSFFMMVLTANFWQAFCHFWKPSVKFETFTKGFKFMLLKAVSLSKSSFLLLISFTEVARVIRLSLLLFIIRAIIFISWKVLFLAYLRNISVNLNWVALKYLLLEAISSKAFFSQEIYNFDTILSNFCFTLSSLSIWNKMDWFRCLRLLEIYDILEAKKPLFKVSYNYIFLAFSFNFSIHSFLIV